MTGRSSVRGAVRAGVVSAVLAAVLGGCGYTTGSLLDAKYQTIFVSPFYNQARDYGLEAALTDAVSRKFLTDGRLEVSKSDQADLLLEGVILDYRLRGITYDQDDNVTQFLTVVTAGVRVTDTETGEIVWQDELLAGESTYYTRAAGQSSNRLRGNAEVFLPVVRTFPSEEENRAASEALEQLASDIFYRTVEPW